MATEEPSFVMVERTADFEVRDYPALVVAETRVSGSRSGAANGAFQRLAGYIFGGNTPNARIAMTAPVRQVRQDGQRIAMTAPVTQARDQSGDWVVQFIMPAGSTLATMPAPRDPTVRLREEPARRMAVARFSGAPGERELSRRADELVAAIAARGLAVADPTPMYAFYDPPWTLPFMRRNEIMVALPAP